MMGITHQVNVAPPVATQSVAFMAVSIAIIEISDIPIAVLKASRKVICRHNMIVSRAMDVIKPLMIARIMMRSVGHGIPLT